MNLWSYWHFRITIMAVSVVLLLCTAPAKADADAQYPNAETVLQAVDTFEKGPTSPQGRRALNLIVEFTQNSESVRVDLFGGYFPWEKGSIDGQAQAALVGAFVAGNIRPQLRTGKREDHPVEGLRFMLNTYSRLAASRQVPRIAELDAWLRLDRNDLAILAARINKGENKSAASTAASSTTDGDDVDWVARQKELTAQYVGKFKPPEVGSAVTVDLRIGGQKTGRLTALSTTSLSLDGKTYTRSQLLPESCPALFAVDWAPIAAKEQVAKEKAEYEDRLARQRAARQAVVAEQTRGLSEALQLADAEKSYDRAVLLLETAIGKYPEAQQLGDAKRRLTDMQTAHVATLEAEKKRQEEEKRKQAEAEERQRREKAEAEEREKHRQEEAVADAAGKAHASDIPGVVNGLLREPGLTLTSPVNCTHRQTGRSLIPRFSGRWRL